MVAGKFYNICGVRIEVSLEEYERNKDRLNFLLKAKLQTAMYILDEKEKQGELDGIASS